MGTVESNVQSGPTGTVDMEKLSKVCFRAECIKKPTATGAPKQ
jgi:hypothetical protein